MAEARSRVRRIRWAGPGLIGLLACEGAPPVADYQLLDTLWAMFDSPQSAAAVEAFREGLPFDSIELVHAGCFGPCPRYSVRLRRDGTATYRGGALAPRAGSITAEVGLAPFGRICEFIEVNGIIEQLQEHTPAGVIDWDSFELRFWSTGNPEAVEFTGGFSEGPPAAWALRSALDGVLLSFLHTP